MYDRRNRRGGVSPLLIMLLGQIYSELNRLPVKPPITIALLAVNIAAHVLPNMNVLGYYLSDIGENCLHPSKIFYSYFKRNSILWNRIVLSGFIHADDHHLYYNMLSLLWKGIHLETALGSETFLILAVYSLIASHTIALLISYALLYYFNFSEYDSGFNTCAVGFSAVLFSFKYVHNSMSNSLTSNVMGLSVATKYVCWLELVLIHYLVPRSSFIGHLAGILAGAMYVHGWPLVKRIVGNRNNAGTSYGNPRANNTNASTYTNSRYTYASGTVG